MTSQEQSYCEILLTKGQVAIVDPADYVRLSQYGWYCMKVKGKMYAARKASELGLHHATILMHREVLGLKFGDKRQGDHIKNTATLDNRRSNLRIATHTENCWNSAKKVYNKSGFKGVSEDKKAAPEHRWRARITVSKREVVIGTYPTPGEAHAAYKEAAVRFFGEFARS